MPSAQKGLLMSGILVEDRLPRLLQDLIWVNLAVFVGNLSSYGYQFGLSRGLSVADYGLWNALLAITLFLQIPLWTISMVVARRVAHLEAQGAREQIRHFLRQVSRTILRGVIIGLLIYAILSPILLTALDIASPIPLVLLAAAAAVGLFVPLGLATLQGLQRFGAFSLATLVWRTSVFFGLGLVVVGSGPAGAVGGILFANLAGLILSFWMSHLKLSRQMEGRAPDGRAVEEGEREQIWAVAATYALVTCFLYLDLLFARYFLTHDSAGRYATVAVLGKAIYFGPIGVVMLLIPKVASARASARDTTHYLYLALATTALLIAPFVVVYSLFPETVVSILFGDKYKGESTADLMRLYVVAATLLTVAALVGQYYLAKRSTRFIWAFVGGLLVTLVVVLINHQSPNDLAIALIAGDSTTLVGMMLLEVASRPLEGALAFALKPMRVRTLWALADYVRRRRTKTAP